LLSRQIQHLRSTAAVTVVAAVAVSMAAVVAVAAFTAVAAVAAFTAAVVAGGLLVEEITTKAAASVGGQGRVPAERAAGLMAGLKRAAVLAQAEIVCRTFVRQSTMASGIRSAVPVTG
jgi:hypothetical protein